MNTTRTMIGLPAFLRPAPDSMARYMRCNGSNPRLHALNLLWSIWVFLTPLFQPVHAAFWWSLILGYPVFALLFFLIHVRPYRETSIFVAALTLLACASAPFNPSAWSYGVFACVYVPYHGSFRESILKIALIELVLALEVVWLGMPWFVIVILVGICTSASAGSLAGRINAIKNTTQRLSQDEVRRLAATAERERIGRDLHDLLGHTLSLITLKLELSRKLFDRDHEGAKRELHDAEHIARKALAEVRSAVTGIRATDLAAELASAHLMLESSGVRMDYEWPALDLPDGVEPTLALVLREAATNIARHAQAQNARVVIREQNGALELFIADDGRGGVDVHGNGLQGMRERVQALGGKLDIDSPRGQGTTLRARLPLPSAQRTDDTGTWSGALATPAHLMGRAS
ncbi:sensor histidine kinase [Oleiagrimonas sp.]|jgi:two-component system sensor histidine kinase DesK|uniref:sensor histidine kinase n=1 Tax=Oleiagrimonas sp. TaxID=2010330 RepID=UPI0026283981|nr:sensor histidine kinase [Oleiagrimonas sp.]MDA3913775.1 sensor histidine kinase [Oleiagrimonas sp.]